MRFEFPPFLETSPSPVVSPIKNIMLDKIGELSDSEQTSTQQDKPQIPAIIKKIAFCESRDRHFDEKGDVVRGTLNPRDIGKYQINLLAWGGEAKKLGIDVFTEKGNEQMALIIYRRHGTQPWMYSKKCWNA